MHKRLIVFIVVFVSILLLIGTSDAYFSRGDIDGCPGLRYDDLKAYGSGKVIGVIENNTEKFVRFSGTLLFLGIGDKVLADAYVSCLDIPPDSEAIFDTWLLNGSPGKARKAFKVMWVKCYVR